MATRNTAPAWRRAFLRELARSGSVALAAEKCGIDRTSPYQVRKTNPAFAASWERALETARAWLDEGELSPSRLREGAGVGQANEAEPTSQTHPRPLPQARRERRARVRLRDDEVIRASKAGRPCIARPGPGKWTARAERRFIETLSATANVKAAAAAAGVSTVAVYNRRRLWPAFAAQWDAAKAEGYVRIEMMLIHAATTTLDPEAAPEEAREAPAMSVEQAMNLFKLHRASQQGGKPQRYGWRQQEPDIEEVKADMLRRVAAMERARRSE